MEYKFLGKINNSEAPLDFIKCLRLISDGDIKPEEAVKLYHSKMEKANIVPFRTLEEDLTLSSNILNRYA